MPRFRWPPRVSDDHGQSLVEFALASVVFFITVFGILEFGLAVSRYNMVANLAQEGARWVAVRGTTATNSTLQTFVNSRASGLSTTATMSPTTLPLAPGSTVTVVVTSSYTPLTRFIHRTAQIPLSSTARMIISR